MKTIINCTPHPINLIDQDGNLTCELPKGEIIPRLSQTTEVVGEINGIAITETSFDELECMPEEKEGTFYIVSRLVMAAAPERKDLLVPNELVRNAEGQIIGCKSLSRN